MSRLDPDAYHPPRRAVRRLFLHCSASDAAGPAYQGERLLRTVRRWHLARGWSDVGYHALIDKAGVILAGRDLERTPAAQRGHNTGSLAVMVHGLTDFSEASLTACKALCDAINTAHGGALTVHGHCEVSPKRCPVFDYRTLLALSPDGRMPLSRPAS